MTDKARPNWAPGMPESGPAEQPLTAAEMRGLPRKNLHQAFIIGGGGRPGWTSFIVEVEYTLYTPDTPKNAEFELIISEFPPGTQLLWTTFIVPTKDVELIQQVAKKYGYELKQGVLPVAIDDKGTHQFNYEPSPNIYSVSGQLADEQLLAKYDQHWRDVIRKHELGIPWKV